MAAPTVISIGTFDGVHLGHQALIQRCRALAMARPGPSSARVVAIVLDPHPMTFLRPEAVPVRLSSFPRRAELLKSAGADEVIALSLTPDRIKLSPDEFIRTHLQPLNPMGIVEGPDFRFGHNRAGDMTTLRQFPWGHPFTATTIESVDVVLADMTIAPARSSLIRWLLEHGRAGDARRALGRPHRLTGTVVRGDRRGRTIGYPTANLETMDMLPGDGIYASIAHLPDGRSLPAALSVGTKPTFGRSPRTAEAFILNQTAASMEWRRLSNLPEYGWSLSLDVCAWIREQVKFEGLPSLLAQIERDCQAVEAFFRSESRNSESARPALHIASVPLESLT